jgi:hypothetical protein
VLHVADLLLSVVLDVLHRLGDLPANRNDVGEASSVRIMDSADVPARIVRIVRILHEQRRSS